MVYHIYFNKLILSNYNIKYPIIKEQYNKIENILEFYSEEGIYKQIENKIYKCDNTYINSINLNNTLNYSSNNEILLNNEKIFKNTTSNNKYSSEYPFIIDMSLQNNTEIFTIPKHYYIKEIQYLYYEISTISPICYFVIQINTINKIEIRNAFFISNTLPTVQLILQLNSLLF